MCNIAAIPGKLGMEVIILTKRTQKETQFKPDGEKALARKVVGAKIPVELESLLREKHGKDLSAWIRSAIAEKLEREQSA